MNLREITTIAHVSTTFVPFAVYTAQKVYPRISDLRRDIQTTNQKIVPDGHFLSSLRLKVLQAWHLEMFLIGSSQNSDSGL